MGLPTPEHILFIPVVLLLGFVLGWAFGGKAARARIAERAKRARE